MLLFSIFSLVFSHLLLLFFFYVNINSCNNSCAHQFCKKPPQSLIQMVYRFMKMKCLVTHQLGNHCELFKRKSSFFIAQLNADKLTIYKRIEQKKARLNSSRRRNQHQYKKICKPKLNNKITIFMHSNHISSNIPWQLHF